MAVFENDGSSFRLSSHAVELPFEWRKSTKTNFMEIIQEPHNFHIFSSVASFIFTQRMHTLQITFIFLYIYQHLKNIFLVFFVAIFEFWCIFQTGKLSARTKGRTKWQTFEFRSDANGSVDKLRLQHFRQRHTRERGRWGKIKRQVKMNLEINEIFHLILNRIGMSNVHIDCWRNVGVLFVVADVVQICFETTCYSSCWPVWMVICWYFSLSYWMNRLHFHGIFFLVSSSSSSSLSSSLSFAYFVLVTNGLMLLLLTTAPKWPEERLWIVLGRFIGIYPHMSAFNALQLGCLQRFFFPVFEKLT